MAEKLSILCFGDSLTAGYYNYGEHYHPYAEKLKEILQPVLPTTEITTDVAGLPGDLVCSPGLFVSRISEQMTKKRYDLVIFLGGRNDIGYGKSSDNIYDGLKKCWMMALTTGAKVLALTILDCAAKFARTDENRNEVNRLILAHQEDRFFAFDLCAAIPYHSASKEFQNKIFDDGLHLTPDGYDLMGEVIGEHMAGLLRTSALSVSSGYE
ncbi:hypothetical protein N7481_007042 [Penicillium waksmanii]|uniref:uncharacterized protein n=1 Tax=Penicillium waksmanii TaxID=69791 RepID=UPI0025495A7E|nr:uncharacterized protein N7481_007042 [Penicillium waksmanii]KAJ5979744.1 hypothetical protein N7481_007042 [Penicillium waksmanii]